MRSHLVSPAVLFALFAHAGCLAAQAPAQQARPTLTVAGDSVTQRLALRDGSEMIGRIIAVGETSVQFQSAIGTTTIPIDAIVGVTEERGGRLVNGRYYFPNPNTTRLVFGPTGRMLDAGEGYFSDYWIFFPGVSVGLSRQLSLGGGMSILPGQGIQDQLFYFTPKVGVIQRPKFNAAVGALAIALPFGGDDGFDDDNFTAGMLYGVGTWGEPDNSFTAGLGYGFAEGRLADNPAVMLGGETRVSPRASLVTENYLLPGGSTLLSGGVRFLGRGLSVDLALFAADGFCCLPFLGFVYGWK
jgi:hypothetical protein